MQIPKLKKSILLNKLVITEIRNNRKKFKQLEEEQ